jgi:hypothetical protein
VWGRVFQSEETKSHSNARKCTSSKPQKGTKIMIEEIEAGVQVVKELLCACYEGQT